MIHLIDVSASNTFLALSALRTTLVGAVAAAILAAFRVKSTSARLFVWKAVLFGGAAMPLLCLMLPPIGIPIPLSTVDNKAIVGKGASQSLAVASQSEVEPNLQEQQVSSEDSSSSPLSIEVPAAKEDVFSLQRSRFVSSLQAIDWNLAMVAAYLAGVLFLVGRFVIGKLLSQKLVRAAQAITDGRLSRAVSALTIRSAPRFAETASVSVPVTVGARRPTILLPLCWREWDDEPLAAVIAHEVSHVSRHDPLTQQVSLLHRAIFWFSPFAWWLDRHLAALAEQASDEAALAGGVDRNHYAKTLLGFFETLHAAPGRIHWQGVSMAEAGQAEKRLERILAWKGAGPMILKKSLITAIVALAIPVLYVAASVRPATARPSPSIQESTAPAAAPIPPAPANSSMEQVSTSAPAGGVSAPAIADVPPIPGEPAEPVGPNSPFPQTPGSQSSGSSMHEYSYSYGYDDDDRFVIASGKSNSYTMSGSTQDVHHVERLKKQIPGDFIWFQRDEKSYIIRDQATVDRARSFWAPQEELGKKQEELGKRQEALGRQQEELGRKQEQIRVNVPADLTARLDALKAKLQKLGPSATMEQIGDLQSEIGDLQGQIGEIQGRAGDQQGKLGEEQGKLGEQQGRLGEEQGKLGEEQGKLAEEAVKKTKALFDESIKNGKAHPEPESLSGASL